MSSIPGPDPRTVVKDTGPRSWTTPGPVAQRPPRLLLTLLGDYWWQRTESLPSAAIVALLSEFGVSDSAARAALSRLTRNGLLVTSRSGRRTFVRLSDRAAGILDDGARRIFSFGDDADPWDGLWSLVAFSIPENNRAARDDLRKTLRWLGFAPLYDGLWVSPRDRTGEVLARLEELGIGTATAFRATAADGVPDIAAQAWNLTGLRAGYEEFITFAGDLRDQAAAGSIAPMDALIARTRVMNEWRAFPALDPDLPADLLPPAWPRARARELFIGCYDLLAPLAGQRVRQIIARYSPELAGRAAHHTSELAASRALSVTSVTGSLTGPREHAGSPALRRSMSFTEMGETCNTRFSVVTIPQGQADSDRPDDGVRRPPGCTRPRTGRPQRGPRTAR